LRGFLEAVHERQAGRAGGAHESEAPVEGEGLDAIRLMTIHRAKGLEFHTVCVADLGRSVRPPYELVRVGADGRLGLRLIRSGVAGRASAFDYETLANETRQAEEREERRLFYVAMTRARERLILSGATRFEGWLEGKWTGGGPAGWIAPAFVADLGQRIGEGGGDVTVGDARVRLTVEVPGATSADAGPVPESAAPHAAPRPAVPPVPVQAPPGSPVATLSYSALGAYARCGYRFYCERVLGLPPVADPAAAPEPSPSGAEHPSARSPTERGVLLHALLERL